MGTSIDLAALKSRVGTELGVSQWVTVDQQRINQFAEVTGDRQYIHVDPARAAGTAFGGTIAHGLLTLSLMGEMADVFPEIAGAAMGVNYGFDKIRFLHPVHSGSRIRARCRLDDLTQRSADSWLARYGITIEIEGVSQPAMIADWLILTVMADRAAA